MRFAKLARLGFSIVDHPGEFGSCNMNEGQTTFGAGLLDQRVGNRQGGFHTFDCRAPFDHQESACLHDLGIELREQCPPASR